MTGQSEGSAPGLTLMFIWWNYKSNSATPEVTPEQPEVKQETSEKSEVPEILNETEVESDLKSRKRHAEDEIEIKADIVGESTLLEIEEDHGQASEEDKDLYPPRRES